MSEEAEVRMTRAKLPAQPPLRLGQVVYVPRNGEMAVGRVTRWHAGEGTATVLVNGAALLYPLDSVFMSKRHFVAGERVERWRGRVAKAERVVVRAAERWSKLDPPGAGKLVLLKAGDDTAPASAVGRFHAASEALRRAVTTRTTPRVEPIPPRPAASFATRPDSARLPSWADDPRGFEDDDEVPSWRR